MREAHHERSKIISKGDTKLGKQAATEVVLKHRVEEPARHKEEAAREEEAREAPRRQALKEHLVAKMLGLQKSLDEAIAEVRALAAGPNHTELAAAAAKMLKLQKLLEEGTAATKKATK